MRESMVERVARALADLESRQSGVCIKGPDEHLAAVTKMASNPERIERARAAIAAMREPTEAMMRAGVAQDPDYPGEYAAPEEYWRAMIDEALR